MSVLVSLVVQRQGPAACNFHLEVFKENKENNTPCKREYSDWLHLHNRTCQLTPVGSQNNKQ